MRAPREHHFYRRFQPNENGYNRSIRLRCGPRRLKGRFNSWNYPYFRRRTNIFRPLPSIWNDLRRNDLLCDATVESAEKKSFRVHRVILAASSDYFKAVFTHPLSTSTNNLYLGYPSNIVECILDYCYTGKCHLNANNVKLLLPASDEYGVLGLIEICCRYLKQILNPKNCWGIYEFCKIYSCEDVALKAKQFAINHFIEFYRESAEFLSMSVQDLTSLLSDNHLNIDKEEQVFNAADFWLRCDIDNRSKYAAQLLMCVRVNYLDKSFYYGTVLKAPYIEHVDKRVIDIMNSAILKPSLTLLKDPRTGVCDIIGDDPPFWPRVPHEIVFAIGGWSRGSPTNCVETYDIRANYWFTCSKRDSVARAYHGLVCVNNIIFMIGGSDGRNHFRTVRSFDPVLDIWIERACMHHARCYVSCVVLHGYIYAIGGYDGQRRLNSVEKYSISRNQWEEVAPMNRARSDAGATVYEDKKIYVSGGFNGQDVLDSAEVYDPCLDRWTFVKNMNTPRSGLSLVNYRGYIHAIGGFNGYQRLKSIERFHPLINHDWDQNLPEMLNKRSNFSCAVVDNILIVVGGFTGTTTTALTECYDGRIWYPLSSMNVNRSALAVCTVTGLPNANIYTLSGKIKPRPVEINGKGEKLPKKEFERMDHQQEPQQQEITS